MENAEEIFHFLEEFSKRKPKTIPQELNDYLAYVARTGDPVYQWSLVKSLFKEKLLNVITDFYETTPSIEIPPYPNVDPFNYDIMKNSLLERLDSFTSAPFTVQRICELLTYPRKQYNRVDKFMRAIEKNILVVSTREPGTQRHVEPENGEAMEPIVNGTDNAEYNVDVEMEDMSWKVATVRPQPAEPQPSSSDTHISVDDIEARLQAKQDAPMDTQEKTTISYESVTPPELNVGGDEEIKPSEKSIPEATTSTIEEETKPKDPELVEAPVETKVEEVEMKVEEEPAKDPLDIPEIKVDDAEMTEQKLNASATNLTDITEEKSVEPPINIPVIEKEDKEPSIPEEQITEETQQQPQIDESSSDSTIKEEPEPKVITEVSTSSEESSSSSDNTDGNSNSPKPSIETSAEVHEEMSHTDSNPEPEPEPEQEKQPEPPIEPEPTVEVVKESPLQIESDNYSISDVNSELKQPPAEPVKSEESEPEIVKEPTSPEKKDEELKAEITETSTETKES